MYRVLQSLLIATLLGTTLAGCVVAPAHPRRPPPPIVEVVPVAPAPGYHWVAGHYRWRADQWVWVPGHWRY
ncbi:MULTISPECIES: YXWGXW repeat-containing protein [Pseudomonas]|uniref:YXWGXW repeat-containing protein n=1 Tax=Pseudomonas piscis TaxID=2614538 RepID=A0A7X1PRC6_9PSED|nr:MULTISPECIES: YXWGXW repeat-containing protein [Pseudomonas]AZC19651.1 hypothetical protein C4K40_4270 [Pseudomonas sp. CMR5c]MCU7647584.1 YXWGXW repeat-containing protein [Pseudomonas piscis]MQA57006.1 hypothetical protein [Pseudomonas piscis]